VKLYIPEKLPGVPDIFPIPESQTGKEAKLGPHLAIRTDAYKFKSMNQIPSPVEL